MPLALKNVSLARSCLVKLAIVILTPYVSPFQVIHIWIVSKQGGVGTTS